MIHLFSMSVEEYSEAFRLFDRDNDTFINAKELSLLIRSLERNPSDKQIQQMIEYVNGKGKTILTSIA